MGFLAPAAGAAAGGGSMLGTIANVVGIGATIASTVVGMQAAQAQAQAQYQMAMYQAKVAENNAIVAQDNAKQQRQVGAIDQQEQDFEALAVLAEERAKQGASGFTLNSTAFQRRNATLRMLARRDALRIRDDAERKAIAFENQASGELASARMSEMEADNALTAGKYNSLSTLIGGASMISNQFSSMLSRRARAVSMPYA